MNTTHPACGDAVTATPTQIIPGTTAGNGLVMRLVAVLFAWHDRATQRRALGRLDEHLLRDIGIDRATAKHEAAKPFWRS